MDDTDTFEPACNNAGVLQEQHIMIVTLFSFTSFVLLTYKTFFKALSLKKFGLQIHVNQNSLEVWLKKNCKLNSKLPGKHLFPEQWPGFFFEN